MNAYDHREAPSILQTPEMPEHGNDGIRLISRLNSGLAASLIAVVLSCAAIVGAFYFSASRINTYATEKSVEQIERLMQMELGRMEDLALEYSWWNEAVELMVYGRDIEWSNENVGDYLQDRYGIDFVLSFDLDGNLAYGKQGETLLQSNDIDLIRKPQLQAMIEQAINTDMSDPQPAGGIIQASGQPAFATVVTHAVYAPTELDPGISHGYFVLVKILDSKLLSAWSDDFQINDLRYVPVPANGNAITGHDGALALRGGNDQVVGHLRWSPDRAGDRFLNFVLPWAAAAAILMLLACVIFYLKLRHYSRVAQENFRELVANRQVLLRQAKFDFLTGLINRSTFLEAVERETRRCLRHGKKAAVVYIDLDGFKAVNDTMGHERGDQLLRMVAEKLVRNVRQEDVVARFGGDEFCILLTDIHGPADIERALGKIHTEFYDAVEIGARELHLGASAGIVVIPEDTSDSSNIFRFADLAMYTAKARGNNGHCFYSQELEKASERQITLRSHLSKALEANELYLAYQPIYELEHRSVKGLEALLRWQSPELGEVSPDEFVPIAEQSALIDSIGIWVAEQALRDLAEFDRATDDQVFIAINVSVKQLSDPLLPEKLDALIRQYGRETCRLKLEITETLLISEYNNEHSVLADLRKRGYKLVLDDFGTGYSALGYLQKYPLETIKIDKSFISEKSISSNDQSLVRAIVNMAETLGMTTVAEGLETEEQEAFIRSTGCTYGQGFLYSRPERLEKMVAFLKTQCSLTSQL